MKIDKSKYKVETLRGTGPGGQHKNKTDSAVRITHIQTGLSAYADERSQSHSKKLAWKDLQDKIKGLKDQKRAEKKKEKRDRAIKERNIIRTYDFKAGTVKDHRTGKVAPLKEVLGKGRIDKMRD